MKKFAVFGYPIKHSLSPTIHQLFAEQFNISLIYEKKCIEPELFESSVTAFFREGGCGLNITLPFKERAFLLAQKKTERALMAKAINTLWQDSTQTLWGDNTDGVGFLRDIKERLGFIIPGKSILILGAGGAVRGILGPLLAESPQQIIIANRTLDRAQTLIDDFKPLTIKYKSAPLKICSFENIPDHPFDLIINGISLGGDQTRMQTLPSLLIKNTLCYELYYGAKTPFMQWAESAGCQKISDGLGMLIEQAAEAFFIWYGLRPKTKLVFEKLHY